MKRLINYKLHPEKKRQMEYEEKVKCYEKLLNFKKCRYKDILKLIATEMQIKGRSKMDDETLYATIHDIFKRQLELQEMRKQWERNQKIKQLQKARLVHDTSAFLKEHGRLQLTDDETKMLGPGAIIMRDRVKTGEKLPRIVYAKKSFQSPEQKIKRQTLKRVVSDMNDDVFKKLLEFM
jgi:hypothetical protein